jgi:hypothetical protein
MIFIDPVDHSQACAQHIYDNEINHIDYADHCDEGKDPRQHVLWSAAHVLNITEEEGFQAEYQEWDEKQTAKTRVRGTW